MVIKFYRFGRQKRWLNEIKYRFRVFGSRSDSVCIWFVFVLDSYLVRI